MRREFDDLIVSFTGPKCDYSNTAIVYFPARGAKWPDGRIGLRVVPVARQAFRALAAVMLHYGYVFEETAGGTLNCRYVGGTSVTSFHAHGTAGDFNPSRNKYRVSAGLIQWGLQTDMPKAMVAAIEAIRSVSGHSVWEWGGRWFNIKDPMHYELDLYRSQLNTGINLASLPAGSWSKYVAFEAGAPSSGGEQMFDQSTPGPSPAVAMFQRDLISLGYKLGDFPPIQAGLYPPGADGWFRATAETQTKVFQKNLGLTVTGKGDALTVATAANLARYAERGGTAIDQTARNAAKAAQTAANRANTTLDKIRSE
jgi:hypothetical protein